MRVTCLRKLKLTISNSLRTKERAALLLQDALTSPSPIWTPLTTREIGRLLRVSVQVLANWRVRDQGPPFTHAARGKGNRCLYTLSEVLAWMSARPTWEFDRAWLVARGLAPEDANEDYVAWARQVLSQSSGFV
ncbi:helix-turn-helix domain-containing protein [Roseovarius confluentis]|uniref:helix-turn-helix domain-containing protein n=1 Tax=Roseovarius confluentis TaxID=1852027 RepID=UPI003BAAC6B7